MKTKLIYIITLMLICSCNDKNASIITKVYVDNKNQSMVFFDTKQKEKNILLSDSNYVYWVMDTIQNNKWVVIERAASRISAGSRVETENLLFYVPEKKEIPPPFSPFHFERRNGIAYLLGSDDKAIPLGDLLNLKSQ
jgi:hypothetical protein